MASLRTESEISSFEAANGVSLPVELKEHLATAHFGSSDHPWEYLSNGWIGDPWDDASMPFQWTTSDAEMAIQKRLHEDPHFSLEGDEEKESFGYLTLLRYGCGWLDGIVINGEQCGMVWGGGNCLWYPHHDKRGRQLSFRKWHANIYEPYRKYMNSQYPSE